MDEGTEAIFFDINGNELTAQEWAEIGPTVVGKTTIDGYRVSTIHLGINHAYDRGPHLTFETMIFIDNSDMVPVFPERQERYNTLEEAKAGHQAVVKWLRRIEVWK